MSQPIWEYVDNLGDASPIEYGGYFLYCDTTGVYGFEAELLQEPCDDELDDDGNDDNARWTVYRVCLDRCKVVTDSEDAFKSYLVPFSYDETWPHPVSAYVEWFADKLTDVADCCGTTHEELISALCSDDGKARANAYRDIASYHGWENFDSYPLMLTRTEVEARYAKEFA